MSAISCRYFESFRYLLPVCCLSLSLLLFSSLTFSMQDGPYMGAKIAYSQFKISHNNTISFDNEPVVDLALGYNFYPWVGIEISATNVDDLKDDQHKTTIDLTQIRTGISMWGELSSRVDMYAKIQASFNQMTLSFAQHEIDESSDMGLYYEAGIVINFTKMLALTTGISHSSSTFDNQFDYQFNTINTGVLFRF